MSGASRHLGMPVGTEGENDSFREAEYAAIHSMLDQINSCTDHVEEKNDHLHPSLQELLESNRLLRPEFQQQLMEAPAMPAPKLWKPLAGSQPCLPELGSILSTHHLA
ncbi:bublin coiled-coil protein-like [Hippopotamus amphibius kiboko]|uniref:bublin coiled-coil protein-like n=1 Tax=Hippopotamus amphibius kiboko TaxID=575201 RepID=UPI00259A9E8E|nr:bublin coiled-coil protein-like [Hippopotamus amphibius kiboko]